MTAPPTFVSRGWYRIRQRGWCCVVYCDKERPRHQKGEGRLVGERVIIDGEVFDCLAVESHALGTPIRRGEEIGLLVCEVPDQS